MLTEITVRQIQRHIQKGNSVQYICYECGVSRSVVYRMLSEGCDNYVERARNHKRVVNHHPERHGYKQALLPEQWQGAEVLIGILQRLKGMSVEKPTIDLEALRGVWQRKMDEVTN